MVSDGGRSRTRGCTALGSTLIYPAFWLEPYVAEVWMLIWADLSLQREEAGVFVVTADQRGSRVAADLVPGALNAVGALGSTRLALPPERTAGDEIQAAIVDASAALAIVLDLTRSGQWSVGVGIGPVETPLPEVVRAARGEAFLLARDAVDRAKRATTRLAISTPDDSGDAEALVRLLIELRDRRTAEGWEVYDLLAGGRTQRDAAERLGISQAAVSLRVKSAALRLEEAAVPALTRMLERIDAAASAPTGAEPAQRPSPVSD